MQVSLHRKFLEVDKGIDLEMDGFRQVSTFSKGRLNHLFRNYFFFNNKNQNVISNCFLRFQFQNVNASIHQF